MDTPSAEAGRLPSRHRSRLTKTVIVHQPFPRRQRDALGSRVQVAVAMGKAREFQGAPPAGGPPATVQGRAALTLLNGFEFRSGATRIELPLSAQRLLAFLALQPRGVLRIYVAGVLWVDAAEDRSLANLRSTLWRLRRSAGTVVEARGSQLQLAPDVAVDVRALSELARSVLEERTDCAAIRLADLTHGDLLPTWYDDWVLMERECLRHARLHALEALCDLFATAGKYWHAVEAGLAAVRGDPLRESAQRALIRAHLAEGNTLEARRQYRAYEDLLGRELGIRPSARIEQLVQELPVKSQDQA